MHVWKSLLPILLIALLISEGYSFEFTIVHNNDMHARYDPVLGSDEKCGKEQDEVGLCYGGFGRVATAVAKARAEGSAIYLNAGDTFQGTAWFTVYKGKMAAQLMNLIGPDALSLGNHEFDNNIDGLVNFLNIVSFPVVCSNLDIALIPEFQNLTRLVRSTIITKFQAKIGIIGYITPATKNHLPLYPFEFEEEIQAINKEAQRLVKMGVNIIIALGHSGYKKDKEIAEKCPEVDIVVGGHSHTFLYTGEPPDMELPEGPYPTVVAKKNGIQVPVVQAFAFTKYLGKLLVEFDSSGKLIKFSGNPILLDKSIEPRGDIMAVINKKRGMVKNLEEQVIGTTKVFLNGDYQACRLVECNFGNLIADSMVYARLEDNKFQDYWTDASAAIINSGAVRGSITRTSNGGAVTVEDIYQVLPYDSKVIFIKILGKYILRILEHSVQMRETDSDGGFLQVSGMRIKYDLKERKGRRVRSVLILCTECKVPQFQPLDPYKLYGILLTQYLLDEGDGYKFKINERHIADTKVTVLQAVTRYFQAHKLVYPKLENRIMIADNDRTGCSETKRLTYVVFIFSIYILLF